MKISWALKPIIWGLIWRYSQELRKKYHPKKFFYVGENLSFGLFDFLETHFTITFHDLSHFWQGLLDFAGYSSLYTAVPISCGHVDIIKSVLPWPAGWQSGLENRPQKCYEYLSYKYNLLYIYGLRGLVV